MEIVGWIALGILSVFGLIAVLMLAFYFMVSEFKVLMFRIHKTVEIKQCNIRKKAEAKKERNARMIDAENEFKDLKTSKVVSRIKIKSEEVQSDELKQDITHNEESEVVEEIKQEEEVLENEVNN